MKNNKHKFLKETVLNLIPEEKANRITLRQLGNLTSLSYRKLKKIITELRKNYPICSQETDGGGYWMAESEKDILDFINMIDRRRQGYTNTILLMSDHLRNF